MLQVFVHAKKHNFLYHICCGIIKHFLQKKAQKAVSGSIFKRQKERKKLVMVRFYLAASISGFVIMTHDCNDLRGHLNTIHY